jgi:hypothetical protein
MHRFHHLTTISQLHRTVVLNLSRLPNYRLICFLLLAVLAAIHIYKHAGCRRRVNYHNWS